MNPDDRASLYATVFRKTGDDPRWLGYWLARHRRSERIGADQLAEQLGIGIDDLVLLSLCRTPRDDHFLDDLGVVCRRTGAREDALAQLLRQEQVLLQWADAPAPSATGWLMAASDRAAAGDEIEALDEAADDDPLD